MLLSIRHPLALRQVTRNVKKDSTATMIQADVLPFSSWPYPEFSFHHLGFIELQTVGNPASGSLNGSLNGPTI